MEQSKLYELEWTRDGLSSAFTPDGLAMANCIREFSAKLHEEFRGEFEGQLVYSPLGVAILCAMAQLTTTGTAKLEILENIGLPARETVILNGINSILEFCSNVQKEPSTNYSGSAGLQLVGGTSLEERRPSVGKYLSIEGLKIHCIQKFILQMDYVLKDDFSAAMQSSFRTKVDRVNFKKDDIENIALNINSAISEATNYHIKFVLPFNSLEKDSKIVLINSLHLSAVWRYRFPLCLTQKRKFYPAANTEPIEVVMMESEWLNLRYTSISEMDAKMVILPFRADLSEALDMIIILPNEVSGLSKIEDKLQQVTLSELLWSSRGFYERKRPSGGYRVKIFIPRLRIVSNWNLKPHMKKLGVKTIFKNLKAEFASVANNPLGLKISVMQHKVVMTLNENGIGINKLYSPETPKHSTVVDNSFEEIRFMADHPFYFQVVQRQSGLPILNGTCTNPLIGLSQS